MNYIIEWYKLYPNAMVFIGHKGTHLGVGALIAFIIMHFSVPIAIVLVMVAGIGKEISDRSQSYDSTAPKGEEYRYDAPLSAHVLDVIVTTIGGAIGLGLGFTSLYVPVVIGAMLAVTLGSIILSQQVPNDHNS